MFFLFPHLMAQHGVQLNIIYKIVTFLPFFHIKNKRQKPTNKKCLVFGLSGSHSMVWVTQLAVSPGHLQSLNTAGQIVFKRIRQFISWNSLPDWLSAAPTLKLLKRFHLCSL